jgi:hypothetical protein
MELTRCMRAGGAIFREFEALHCDDAPILQEIVKRGSAEGPSEAPPETGRAAAIGWGKHEGVLRQCGSEAVKKSPERSGRFVIQSRRRTAKDLKLRKLR